MLPGVRTGACILIRNEETDFSDRSFSRRCGGVHSRRNCSVLRVAFFQSGQGGEGAFREAFLSLM